MKKFNDMNPKERRSALGGSASALVRRKKKYEEMKIMEEGLKLE